MAKRPIRLRAGAGAVDAQRQQGTAVSPEEGPGWEVYIPGGNEVSPAEVEQLRMESAAQYQKMGKDLQRLADRMEKAREKYREQIATTVGEKKWTDLRKELERERQKVEKVKARVDENGFEDPAPCRAAFEAARERSDRYLAGKGIDPTAIKKLSRKMHLSLSREWAKLMRPGQKEVQR